MNEQDVTNRDTLAWELRDALPELGYVVLGGRRGVSVEVDPVVVIEVEKGDTRMALILVVTDPSREE
jgi:hypothetical protein